MKSKFKKILLILLVLILGYMIFSKDVSGVVINTQSILRQTPSSPPTPPDKPEPPCPPSCVTPTPTPPPEPTPTPTPVPPIGGNSGPPAGGGGNGGPPGPPICGALTPSAPILFSATKSGNKADLSWTAVDLATHYSILYGETSGNYVYGVDNTGKTTNFNVGGLGPASDYCFAVRAVNDCAPGDLSNEICSGKALVGKVLGVSTLGATGQAEKKLVFSLYIIGSVCLLLGIRTSFPRRANLLSQN